MAKKLYTEETIRGLAPGGELVLGSDAIATPAALDAAYMRGIRVRFADGGSTPSAKGEHDCPWQRMLASDGTYVVEIKAGSASVTKLEPSGPVAFASQRKGSGCA
jgi:hypothetical protein